MLEQQEKRANPLKTPRFDGIRLTDVFPNITDSNSQEQEIIGTLAFGKQSQLDDREKFILQRRFWEGKLLNEIAWEMELSTVRVKQLHDRALEKIKRQLTSMQTYPIQAIESEGHGTD